MKRGLLGRPLATAQEHEQRLSKRIALAVFSSDAISSNAYATEEILIVLALAGTSALAYSLPIAAAVTVLLVLVALSYQQTVHAYPSGGGSYVVSRENLGLVPGLVAGASLSVDYVMTVAVSVSSGVAAITSAFPSLHGHRVLLAVALIILVALVNLRGVKESGGAFALPTYAFVLLAGGLVLAGTYRWMTGSLEVLPAPADIQPTHALTLLIIARAFSGGCSAMTGTEAISNGVPSFKPPESRNAAITLGIMAAILAALFLGLTNLARALEVHPSATETVVSQIGRSVFGGGTFLYFALQVATMAILVLAANTSFAGFPRLSAILAVDGFLPRQLSNRGDRLVFSNGVIGLALLAIFMVIAFGAETHRLIPLYAIGVFVGFTLSQTGMVRHWWRDRGSGWRHRAALNGVGAVMTGVVAAVIVVAKFTGGAYLIVVAIPLVVLLFLGINRHYRRVAAVLEPAGVEEIGRLGALADASLRTTVVLFVSQVNELTARSLALARSLSPDDVHAVTIAGDEHSFARLEENWRLLGTDVPLQAVESPYRELVRPAVSYVRSLEPGPDHLVTVVIPEFVVEHWWQVFLHNQNALRLKGALLMVPWVIVLSVPYHLSEEERPSG
jgi:amino acid transporter